MASHAHHQTVKVRTIDGIDLETWVYPVNGSAPAPAIIMTPGVKSIQSCLNISAHRLLAQLH